MMDLAEQVQAIEPAVYESPLEGYEFVRGYGIFSLPFNTGHVLALRVFPQNDFAPYVTVWHRTPGGVWAIYADAPRLDVACPRYYGAAASHVARANIHLTWTGPMELLVEMDAPKLTWRISITTTRMMQLLNSMSRSIPEEMWRSERMLRRFEYVGRRLLDLGDVNLSGVTPNGAFGILMPRQMFNINTASARLEGIDLGQPARSGDNPMIGQLRLPARGIFAVGGAYFSITDQDEHDRTLQELREEAVVTG